MTNSLTHHKMATGMKLQYDSQNCFTSAFSYMIRPTWDTLGPSQSLICEKNSKARLHSWIGYLCTVTRHFSQRAIFSKKNQGKDSSRSTSWLNWLPELYSTTILLRANQLDLLPLPRSSSAQLDRPHAIRRRHALRCEHDKAALPSSYPA